MAGRWVDVPEAARELEISTDAIRKRIARGSLESSREDGHVLVWLDDSGTEAGREAQVDREALLESLLDQVGYLREIINTRDEEIRRRDVIISQLTSRIPEIEAPAPTPGDSEGREKATQGPAEAAPRRAPPAPGDGGPQEQPSDALGGPGSGTARGSWWARLFGG